MSFGNMEDLADVPLRLSSFCIDLKVENGFLMCSALTGALLCLTSEEHKDIESCTFPLNPLISKLIDEGLVVPSDTDEYSLVDSMRTAAPRRAKEINNFVILPTTDCNARCFYCYEKGINRMDMSPDTADTVSDYIVSVSGGKRVHISWFGGEPTVAHQIITRISRNLKERQVEFGSSMITNGLLLDDSMITIAKDEWKLTQVQITVDGTESVYNQTKSYVGAYGNPYKKLISNIFSLLKAGIGVSVRINLGGHNGEDVSALLEELESLFTDYFGFNLYVHAITGVHSDKENVLLRERATDLNIRLMQRHLYRRIEIPAFTDHSCMADCDDSVVINPQGGLSKCEHYIFEKVFGSVFCPERDETLLHEWKEYVLFNNCHICPLYPRCVHLRWCDGGKFECTDADAANQLKFAKESMLVLYRDWEHTRNTFRERAGFLMLYDVEPMYQDGETSARLRSRADTDQELIIPANDTSYDILTYIQEQRSFHEIVNMLNDRYDTGSYPVEDIVEDYLLQLLDMGLCKQV